MEAYAGTMYDAVWLYALAVNETLEMGTSIRNGLEVAKRTYNRLYEGILLMSVGFLVHNMKFTDAEAQSMCCAPL